MADSLKQYEKRFNAQTIRERSLIAVTILVGSCFLWWNYHAEPKMAQLEAKQEENKRINREVKSTREIVREIRERIAAGVHQEKENQLAKLQQELEAVEESLRLKTVELIDPEQMFALMNELVYRDSNLKLLSLKRREVKPAIPPEEGEAEAEAENGETASDDPGIFRHVLEIEFAGTYLDILQYMQALERLDWKLLWDEIEIVSQEYPTMTVKVVMSTLSTRKEWVGI